MDLPRRFVTENDPMAWWMWMILGLVLAIAEAQIPTNFFLLAFGIGGLVVGALVGLGWGGPPWTQWLAFTLVSVAAVLVFKRTLTTGAVAGAREVDDLRREAALIIEDVPAGGIGRAELRGTTWSARSSDGAAIASGTRCRVDRVDGLTLWLSAE
jgi:membrane protein implicated in regulation of membrane protease activity